MINNINEQRSYISIGLTILAWLAFLLALFVVVKGDVLLQAAAVLYPELSFPVFFIPWFLLLISSVQKLRESASTARLQIWVLKTTIPIFIFVFPFLSQLVMDMSSSDQSLLGDAEVYYAYVAVIALMVAHFLPVFNRKQ